MWWKKVDVVRKEDQHCKKKKKRRILTWNRLMFQATKGQHCKKKDKTKKIEGQHRYWNTLWKQHWNIELEYQHKQILQSARTKRDTKTYLSTNEKR